MRKRVLKALQRILRAVPSAYKREDRSTFEVIADNSSNITTQPFAGTKLKFQIFTRVIKAIQNHDKSGIEWVKRPHAFFISPFIRNLLPNYTT